MLSAPEFELDPKGCLGCRIATSVDSLVREHLTVFIPNLKAFQKLADDVGKDYSGLVKAVEQFRARVEKSDLGLDAWGDAKKIQQARKVQTDAIDDFIKKLKDSDQALDKIQTQMEELKPPTLDGIAEMF